MIAVALVRLRRSLPEGAGKILMLWWNPDSFRQHTQLYALLRFLEERGTKVHWNPIFHFRFSPLWEQKTVRPAWSGERKPSAELPAKSSWNWRTRLYDSLFVALFVFLCSFLAFRFVAKNWDNRLTITGSVILSIGVGILTWKLGRWDPLIPVEAFLPLKKEVMDTKIALREVTRILLVFHYQHWMELSGVITFRLSGIIRRFLSASSSCAVFVEPSADSLRVVGPRKVVQKVAKLWEALVNID
jgi:hypothetical protein